MEMMRRHLRALVVGAIVVVVVLALSAALLAFQAGAAVKRIADALQPAFEMTYASPRVALNGDLSVRDFRLKPRGEGLAVLTAQSATLKPPGSVWFLRAAFGSGALPPIDRVAIALEDVAVEGGGELHPALRWIGARSAAPFEAAGCGQAMRLGAEDWNQLGLRAEPARIEGEYAVTGPGLGTLTVTFDRPGSSRIAHRRVLKLADPRMPWPSNPAQVATVESQWSVKDDGFVAARNRLCARRARVARNLFADMHVEAVQAWVRRLGLAASPQLLETYRRYALRGGELQWASRPRAPIIHANYAVATPENRVRALAATIQATGKPPVPFALAAIPEEPVAALDPAAASAPATTPGSASANPALPDAAAATAQSTTTTASATPSSAPTASATAPVAPPVAPAAPGASATSTAAAAAASDPPPTPATTPATAPAQPVAATPTPIEAPAIRPPPASVASAPAPAATTTPPPPAAPAATKPPAAPATTKPARPPAAPLRTGAASFTALEHAVNRRVAIRTVHNTRRIGVLREWNGEAITLELADERHMLLKVPRDDVVRAEILDTALIPPRPNAQKN